MREIRQLYPAKHALFNKLEATAPEPNPCLRPDRHLVEVDLKFNPTPCLKALRETAEVGVRRRLAAVLAVDVVGYSRLMEQDEAGTLATLKTRRKEVLEPVVA